MAGWVRAGGGGIPSSLKSDMDAVLNKKFGTSTTYPPTGWPDDVNLMGPLPEKTASGAIASFPDGAEDVPVKSAKFYFLPQQASGTPSPSTPLAITGWTGLTGYQQKKNFVDDSQKTKVGGNLFFGGATTNTEKSCHLLPGTYTITVKLNVSANLNIYVKNLTTGSQFSGFPYYNAATTDPRSKTFIVTEAVDVCVWIYNGDYSISTSEIDFCQIEVGSSYTSYAAYQAPTSYPVTWQDSAGTIYGGYVDATRGKVVKTHESVDLGTLDWTITQTLQEVRAFYTDDLTSVIDPPASNSAVLDGFCEILPLDSITNVEAHSNTGISSSTSGRVFLYNHTYASMTKEQFTTAVTGSLFVYPLATPEEYDITAFTPSTYLGSNNFYSDANGDTEITYRADISLLLNSLQNNRGLMMMSIPEEQEETEEPEPESDER